MREHSGPSLLPAFCPQRHLNPDGTFCLGLNAGNAVTDFETRRKWWNKLHVFLTCQDTASETRTWPTSIEISHGAAGVTEVQSEEIAEKLGLLEEYQEAVREKTGVIADAVDRINPATGHLRNGRGPCFCGRRTKKGRIMLRRDCQKDSDACLVLREVRRKKQEDDYWSSLKGKHICCGTMDDCPLKQS